MDILAQILEYSVKIIMISALIYGVLYPKNIYLLFMPFTILVPSCFIGYLYFRIAYGYTMIDIINNYNFLGYLVVIYHILIIIFVGKFHYKRYEKTNLLKSLSKKQ